jgi:FKBP-type peptidyl-prolyl cis-trans isomerase
MKKLCLNPERTLFVVLAFLLFSCDQPVQVLEEKEEDMVSEQFVRANQYSQRRHQDHISAFVDRVGWEASRTPSGLWIVIKNEGDGRPILENSRVTYTYHSTLLDGTPCYESTSDNPMVVVLGKGGIESGVEEGLSSLRKGSEAIFLIPPHLAHGNFGDRDKIPGNSVLIYSLKILEVQ